MEYDVLEQMLAEALRFDCPLFGAGRCRGLDRFFEEVLLHLKHRDSRGLNLLRQHGCQLPGTALPDGDSGMQGRKQNGKAEKSADCEIEGLHRNLRNRLALNGAHGMDHGRYYKLKRLCWETASRRIHRQRCA